MGRSYGSQPVNLKKTRLTKPLLLAIGKLVRAMAEIEDMIDLFVATLAELSETKTSILLGRTGVKRRIDIAEALAAIRKDSALAIHKKAFSADYYDLVDCRNAVAHGTFLGKGDNDRLYFLTSDTGRPEANTVKRIVLSYLPKDIIGNAEAAERLVPRYEQLLKVEGPRAERFQRPLSPHPKAQLQQSAKPQHSPRSSLG